MKLKAAAKAVVRKFLPARPPAPKAVVPAVTAAPPHDWLRDNTLRGALKRREDVPIRSVIDVGASNGMWSDVAMRQFPEARYLLIEAQVQAHGAALAQFKTKHRNVDYVLAAAGNRVGEIYFDATDPLGGAAAETPFAKNNLTVPMTTIDREVATRGLQPPFLVKLDTHGFEVPILEGAVETLRGTNLLIIEVYNFQLCPGCLRFEEMCAWLEKRGFRCVDIFDILRRPKDRLLWQMDMVFARADVPAFKDNFYQ